MQISLLTCTPGTAVYELYGHTALRVQDVEKGWDVVFNYGVFSFEDAGFAWRFVLGQTDYELWAIPYDLFIQSYEAQGRGVVEQVLNLTPAEANRMVVSLFRNADPAHRTYRYNFFYKNCTTQALEQIDLALEGERVQTAEVDTTRTLRQIVAEHSACSPWSALGQDLLLGAEVDQPATEAVQSFAPLYAERFVATSVVRSADGTTRPLVSETRILVPERPQPAAATISPTSASLLVLSVLLLLTLWKRRSRKWRVALDAVLVGVQSVVGILLTFMLLCSGHPAVDSNFLVLFFNPLPALLWGATFFGKRQTRTEKIFIGWELIFALSVEIIGLLGVQTIPPAVSVLLLAYILHYTLRLLPCKPKP